MQWVKAPLLFPLHTQYLLLFSYPHAREGRLPPTQSPHDSSQEPLPSTFPGAHTASCVQCQAWALTELLISRHTALSTANLFLLHEFKISCSPHALVHLLCTLSGWAWAAVTHYHGLGGLYNKALFLTVLEARSLRLRLPADSVSGETGFADGPPLAVSAHSGKRENLSRGSSHKGTSRLWRLHPHVLVTPQGLTSK